MAMNMPSNIVVEKLLGYCQSNFSEIIAPYFGGSDKVNEIEQILTSIQTQLLDPETQGADGYEPAVEEWLKTLEHVLQRLEHLFDEVHKEIQLPKSCCINFPISNKKTTSRKAKAILGELKSIKSDPNSLLNLSVEANPVVNPMRQSGNNNSIHKEADKGQDEDDRLWLKSLWPSPDNPESLKVVDWKGERFPDNWGMGDKFPARLEKLVSLHIVDCNRCQHLPPDLSRQLPHLKFLQLWNLEALEYIEISNGIGTEMYFPSLERLQLYELPQLKAWFKEAEDDSTTHRLSFPNLSEVRVSGCLKLNSMPQVPRLKSLEAQEAHPLLVSNAMLSDPSSLNKLYLDLLEDLPNINGECFDHLVSLTIKRCPDFETGTECSDGCFISLFQETSLKELEIEQCQRLDLWYWEKNDGGLACFETLRSLVLRDITPLESLPEFLSCCTMLEQLNIEWLYNLTALPKWIHNLTQLRELTILNCHKLTMLPESFGDLKSLDCLRISGCPQLEKRCREPGGEYRPLIQHISQIHLGLPQSTNEPI